MLDCLDCAQSREKVIRNGDGATMKLESGTLLHTANFTNATRKELSKNPQGSRRHIPQLVHYGEAF